MEKIKWQHEEINKARYKKYALQYASFKTVENEPDGIPQIRKKSVS